MLTWSNLQLSPSNVEMVCRDILEARSSEYKAWAQVQSLNSSLDEHNLELRVKTAIEAEAISQQRLAAAEAEIADLRQKFEASKRCISSFILYHKWPSTNWAFKSFYKLIAHFPRSLLCSPPLDGDNNFLQCNLTVYMSTRRVGIFLQYNRYCTLICISSASMICEIDPCPTVLGKWVAMLLIGWIILFCHAIDEL